jgi:hypothetical protein
VAASAGNGGTGALDIRLAPLSTTRRLLSSRNSSRADVRWWWWWCDRTDRDCSWKSARAAERNPGQVERDVEEAMTRAEWPGIVGCDGAQTLEVWDNSAFLWSCRSRSTLIFGIRNDGKINCGLGSSFKASNRIRLPFRFNRRDLGMDYFRGVAMRESCGGRNQRPPETWGSDVGLCNDALPRPCP